MQANSSHRSLTIEDVTDFASALIDASRAAPLLFRTEKDFYPLVSIYLRGRVPKAIPESRVDGGRIDFRIGGKNPAVLELVVAPRLLCDPNDRELRFPGHGTATQLYATQNQSELTKLSGVAKSLARNRYLLLIDLQGKVDTASLKDGYLRALPQDGKAEPVRVVYACADVSRNLHFQVGGKKKGKPRLA